MFYIRYFMSYPRQFFLLTIILFIAFSCDRKQKDSYKAIEVNFVEESSFIGSNSCKSCHEDEFKEWENSHHDQAMKIADSISILGNFNNSIFIHKNKKSTFFKIGNKYYVNTEGPDGNYYDYEIKYTFGFTPLQQYIVKFPNGEYQCLLTAWDSKENKWFHLQPNLEIKHDEWLHWTKGSMRWNTMCADCHSTNLQKNFDSKSITYETSYSEINVSCEACHGPSSLHVDFYNNPIQDKIPPKMYMENEMPSKEIVDKCARCHSRRSQLTKAFDYKGQFSDHYAQSLLVAPTYELDGQIKDEDYVYGSFIQSKMYQNGVSCKDCHNVHSLKLKKPGNNLCLTCHTPNYNTPSHHFHEINTEGSKCINCHMPGKLYMGNDFRRDHSFRNPRPDQTVKYNVPNACNTCHKDKSAEWASNFIISKYGTVRIDHFSDHMLKGSFGDKTAFEHVMSNKKYPEIVRATAINQYVNQQLTFEEVTGLINYLKDSSAVVRNESIVSLEKIGLTNLSEYIKPLLNDSIRIVRISSARYFNMIGQDLSENSHFKNANKEYLEMLDLNSDFASGQHQLGIYHQARKNTDLAIKAYERAIEIDNYYNMSRMNLALLYYERGLIKACEKLYLKVTEQEPAYSYSYYMLGLLYSETGNNKSLEYFASACDKEPANMKAFYNYALKLQKEDNNKESIEVTNKGLKLFTNNELLLYVKLIGQINLNKVSNAKATCTLLIKNYPSNENYRQILQNLELNIK